MIKKVTNRKSSNSDDHRFTLRIPRLMMDKVDIKRKEQVGKISRNLYILQLIHYAVENN